MRRSRVVIATRRAANAPHLELPDAAVEEVSQMGRLEEALANQPAVAVVALDLPGLGGTEGLKTVRKISPATKVIAMTGRPSDGEELDVLRTGAKGYILANNNGNTIAKIVEKVEEGEIWAARRTIGKLVEEMFSATPPADDEARDAAFEEKVRQLTVREQEILRRLSDGLSNKEIATALNVTVSTVKAHLTKVFRKLGLPSRLHLALAADRRDRDGAPRRRPAGKTQ